MLTPDHMKKVVDQYLAAINAGDMQSATNIYADNAAVEDPVGTEPKRGDDILQFYTAAFANGPSICPENVRNGRRECPTDVHQLKVRKVCRQPQQKRDH